jgi:M6 family metalloprotease-like protein
MFMRKLLIIVFVQVFYASLFAVPSNPAPVIFLQSDGTELTILRRGDESVRWYETTDGYTLLRNGNNDMVYAELDRFGEITPSIFLAKNPGDRTPAEEEFLRNVGIGVFSKSENMRKAINRKSVRREEQRERVPSIYSRGHRNQIVILVQYQDVKFRDDYYGTPLHGARLFDSLMNGKNYTVNDAAGSIQKYFHDNSFGQLTIETTIFGPVTLSKNRAFYGGNNSYGEDTNDRQMILEALKLLDADGVDFLPFVCEYTGEIPGVHVIFAGCGEEHSGCRNEAIWSHKWYLPANSYFGAAKFNMYSCSPELDGGETSTMPTHIGVIAHEIGHTLGLWDMYDAGGGSAKGLGPWSVMANGAWNNNGRIPPYLNIFERYMLGWAAPIELRYNEYIQPTLSPIGESNIGYVFYAKDAKGNTIPNERFYVEARNSTRTGLWDRGIPSNIPAGDTLGGLMVYHMDSTNPNVWLSNRVNTTTKENFKIVSAKGTGAKNSYNRDPFNQYTLDSLTSNSSPNSKSWAGVSSGVPIVNIKKNLTTNDVTFLVDGHYYYAEHDVSLCNETSYTFRGNTFTNSTVFNDTIKMPARPDTIHILDLTFSYTNWVEYSDIFCEGSGIFFNNQFIATAGMHYFTLKNSAGCDSVVVLSLTKKFSTVGSVVVDTIYEGDSLDFFGTYVREAGVYQSRDFTQDLRNCNGCDSSFTLILKVVPKTTSINLTAIKECERIRIIPNPIKTGAEFTVIIPDLDHAVVQVLSTTGRVVSSKEVHHETEVRMPEIRSPGMYVVQTLCQDHRIQSERIIVVE